MLLKKLRLSKFVDIEFLFPFIYFVSLLLLFFLKKTNIFFSVDPESQFYSNALLILTGNHTHFIDHPGTFYQMALAYIMLPFRIYYLVWEKSSFIMWWLKSAEYIWIVFRIFNVFLYLLGFYFILRSARLLSRSLVTILLAFLLILNHPIFWVKNPWFFRFGTESMIFFLTGIWLFWTVNIIKGKIDKKFIWLLPIVSGLGLANRAHNTAIPFSTIILISIIEFHPKNLHLVIRRVVKTIFLIILGFIAGTFPGIPVYKYFFRYMISLLTHVGLHGGGDNSLFSWTVLKQSFSALYMNNSLYFKLIPLIIIYILILLIGKSLKNTLYKKFYFSLFMGTIMGLLISLKYPEIHYQIINLTLISYLFSLVIEFIPFKISKFIIIILIFLIFYISLGQFSNYSSYFDVSNRTEDFVNRNKDINKATIWTYDSPTKEYGLIMGLIFSGQYDKELRQIYPNYVNMDSFPKKIYEFNGTIHDIRDFCWEKAFIPSFMKDEIVTEYKYTDELRFYPSPDGNIYYISRLKC